MHMVHMYMAIEHIAAILILILLMAFSFFQIISELVLIIVQSLKEVNGFSHFPPMKL